MKSLLYLLAGLLLWSAAPVWCVWFIYQVFALSAPFWYSVLLTIVGIIVVLGLITGLLYLGIVNTLKSK
jgi:hypothetical protein